MPDGAALATAYELYFMGQNGQWGIPMTLQSRLSSVYNIVLAEVRSLTDQGVHPTESNCEIAFLWLKAVSKMANLKIRQDMILSDLRAVTEKRNLISGFEPSKPKVSESHDWVTAAKAGKLFETQAVQTMPDRCYLLDAESKQIRKMQGLGQISQRQNDGSGAVHWILGETVCAEADVLEGDETRVSQSVEQVVYCIPQASQLWRKKFMYKNITKSLHEYGDWHQKICGESPAKKLGGVHLLLSPARRPAFSSAERSLEACAGDEARDWFKDHPSPSAATEAMVWLESQPSPAVALQAVQCLLQTRGY